MTDGRGGIGWHQSKGRVCEAKDGKSWEWNPVSWCALRWSGMRTTGEVMETSLALYRERPVRGSIDGSRQRAGDMTSDEAWYEQEATMR